MRSSTYEAIQIFVKNHAYRWTSLSFVRSAIVLHAVFKDGTEAVGVQDRG